MRELRRRKGIINPDLTPLIDVVFQLLIFFMLVTTFSQYNKFDMNLPKSSVEEINTTETVSELMKGRKEQTLIVSADKDLRYETVIETMGRLKNIGLEKLEINSIK